MDENSFALLERTTDRVLPFNNLRDLFSGNAKLRIKYGVDVTAPFLHLGHAVNLWQMRLLQDQGHKVVFLLGDFTTKIGDPTGKSATRPVISLDDIEKNSIAFIKQVSRILRTDEDVFEIRRNSEWYGKMPLHEFLELTSLVTHAHLVERDMFQSRIKDGKEIRVHELLYPILQGYDSYMLDADLTIVGSDQLFNENMGRFFQVKFSQRPQIILTTRITPGLDGKNKQSKSLNNYIALEDSPRDKFGKIMSIPDDLIIPYFEVYTDKPNSEIAVHKVNLDRGINPSGIKKFLAAAVVVRYHGEAQAAIEIDWFNCTFSREAPLKNLPTLRVDFAKTTAMAMIVSLHSAWSKTQIRTLCEQGAVRLNDKKLYNALEQLQVQNGDILRVGKKEFYALQLN